MDNKKLIIEKIDILLKEFPLKENVEISPDKKLSEIINIFNSILAERIKAKLYDFFPEVNFEKLNEMSTINDIYELVINTKNSEIVNSTKISTFSRQNKNLKATSKIFDNFSDLLINNQQSLGIDIEKRNSLSENILNIKFNSLRNKIFTPEELIYSISKPDPVLSLIGIYSAKESIKKALGCDQKINFKQINIKHKTSGKPYADVFGYDIHQFLISISHTDELVISVCIFNL